MSKTRVAITPNGYIPPGIPVVVARTFFDDIVDLGGAVWVCCIFSGCIVRATKKEPPADMQGCLFDQCKYEGDYWPVKEKS